MALTPAELHSLINLNITDELNEQNTAERVREVLHAMVGSLQATQDEIGEQNPSPVVGAPAAPTSPFQDDQANTFSGVLVPGYPSVADYEVFGVPGYPGVVGAAEAGADIQSGRLIIRGLTGNIMAGSVGMRVAASGNRPAGKSLVSYAAFTAADGGGTTPPNTPPAVQLAVQQLSNGTIKYTTTASDTDGIASIYTYVYNSGDDTLVATYGPSGNGSTSYVTTRVAPDAGDYYAVSTATDSKGLAGSSSQQPFTVQDTAPTQPLAYPQNLRVTAGPDTNSKSTLAWDPVAGATGYQLLMGGSVQIGTGTATTYQVSPGSYQVQALYGPDASRNSAYSAPAVQAYAYTAPDPNNKAFTYTMPFTLS